ncbi:MAG: site-specific DNA-methyltransferase, partial [Candidatus Poribacteria bacterium]|nr:site-specific DNA-methyltransferase [Candidatus Poribacteria bacterium]
PLVKQYLEAQEQLGSPQTRDQRSDAVFNHLYTFFSRYYDNGDFIPRRRYSQTERYAVPYNGEEVYLHWANRDQYYVKSGEHFSTYRFKSQNITVIFDLRNVDVEKDNVQGAKRFFIPISDETTYSQETDEICLPFEYRPLTDAEKKKYSGQKQQDKIIDAAQPEIIAAVRAVSNRDNAYKLLGALEHKTDDVTALKKHLCAYTRSNIADFFIHKDLKQFLNHELDVYIKNEVMPLSSFIFDNANLQENNLTRVNWIETGKLVHCIASKIVDFLAHIEEFQKCLWLKKKFVLSTDYCLTLNRVPEEFYPEIIKNTAQLEEWKDLFAIHEIDSNLIDTDYTEPLSVEFLKENPNLVLDTCHFDSDFKDRLLACFGNLDNETDGLLIHGENFQALNLLTEKYQESVKAIYIDPPYNTDASAILYKNNYKDSSWMSLMADRLALSRSFFPENGVICVAIDDVEVSSLRLILENLFEKELGIATVRSNPQGRARTDYFSPTHEYALFYGKSASSPGEFFKTEKQKSSYPYEDERGKYNWDNLIRRPPGDNRSDVETMFYPIYVSNDDTIRIPKMVWNDTERAYNVLEPPDEDEVSVLPIKSGMEKRWRHGWDTVSKNITQYRVVRNDKVQIEYKSRMKEKAVPKTWWDEKTYAAGRYGTTLLENMFRPKIFSFPKSVYLVSDCLRSGCLDENETVLDYFGGSGTTVHATINLNRIDNGKRKYILIEVGDHFDTVLNPRIKKAVYAE